MKAITPNPVFRVGADDAIELPSGQLVLVSVADYERHALGRYRWYRGARGRVVASIESDRRTVYLARLLVGAREGERVALRVAEPLPVPQLAGRVAFDYRPGNFRRMITGAST